MLNDGFMMVDKLKITYAYCFELDKNLTIDEAYHASIAMTPSRQFKFSCVESRCRLNGVEITAVGYDKLPSERKVSCYFRRHQSPTKGEHHPDCDLLADYEYNEFQGVHPNETLEEAKLRRKRYSKLHDAIDCYDPKEEFIEGISLDESSNEQISLNRLEPASNSKNQSNLNGKSINKTSSFSRFVRHYHQMTLELSENEIMDSTVEIVGLGKVSYGVFFKFFPLVWGRFAFSGIQHGRIKTNQIKKYGKGFKVIFLAKINGKTVSLYISPEQINQYRNRRELLDIINHDKAFSTITAYFKPTKYEFNNDSCQVIIENLANLVFIADGDKN